MKRRWTVRIVVWKDSATLYPNEVNRIRADRDILWLGELLRYAGISRRLASFDNREVFELRCPSGQDTDVWARQNSERLKSFGLDAVQAPEWGGEAL